MSRFVNFINNTKLIEFPEFRQVFRFDCGANCLQSILAFNDIDMREEDIMKEADTNEEEGTPISGIKKVAKKYKLAFKEGNFTIDNLKSHIDQGFPTLMMVQAWADEDVEDWSKIEDEGHYVIGIGYNDVDKKIIFEDPASIKRCWMDYDELLKRWTGWDDDNKKIRNWGIVFTNKTNYKQNDLEHMD